MAVTDETTTTMTTLSDHQEGDEAKLDLQQQQQHHDDDDEEEDEDAVHKHHTSSSTTTTLAGSMSTLDGPDTVMMTAAASNTRSKRLTLEENEHDDALEEDEFEGDEYLKELLSGTTEQINSLQLDNYDRDKSWKTMDSVHSSNIDMTTMMNNSATDMNDSCASFASFGGGSCSGDSEQSSLGESMEDLKYSFCDSLDNTGPSPSSLLKQQSSSRMSNGGMISGSLGGSGSSSRSNTPMMSTTAGLSSSLLDSCKPQPQSLDGSGTRRSILMSHRSASVRMPKRAPSFRGSLDLIKENSLH